VEKPALKGATDVVKRTIVDVDSILRGVLLARWTFRPHMRATLGSV
jgi:hypothetical protein